MYVIHNRIKSPSHMDKEVSFDLGAKVPEVLFEGF